MLRFERRVVAAMTGATDLRQRAEVEKFVDGTLATMPEHLRAGVLVGSIGLAAIVRVADLVARPAGPTDVVIGRLAELRLGPVQQYFRLFRSLVLFAEHESSPEAST